jgi:signal transduction histidine kinase
VNIADEEAEHLQELIENALEMARLDSAQIDVQADLSDLGAIVRDVVASMNTAIDGRPVEVRCGPQTPLAALDRRLVKLALKQLLDNALKYSPPGTPVALQVMAVNGTVAVEITDHGRGIPAQEQRRIFQRFYRSPSVNSQIPGSGLGLSIAHRIAQAHGGDLTVSSRPGETTFRMTLPVKRKGEAD